MDHFFSDQFGELPNFEWFHDDFVRLQKNGGHGALHVGVAADQHGHCVRLEMTHRGDHGKTVARLRACAGQ